MREIRFKAKTTDTNEWVYGSFIHSRNMAGMPCEFRIKDDNGVEHDVRRETVCQFTAMKDAGGNDIYEGDIINCGSKYDYYIKFIDASFVGFHHNGLKEDGEDYRWGLLSRVFEIDIFKDIVKILRNLHD